MTFTICTLIDPHGPGAPDIPPYDGADLAATVAAAERYAVGSGEALYTVIIQDEQGQTVYNLSRVFTGAWVRLPFEIVPA